MTSDDVFLDELEIFRKDTEAATPFFYAYAGILTRWSVRLRFALNAPHKPRRRASLRRTLQRATENQKGTFLTGLDNVKDRC
jgi:hypothetical protein